MQITAMLSLEHIRTRQDKREDEEDGKGLWTARSVAPALRWGRSRTWILWSSICVDCLNKLPGKVHFIKYLLAQQGAHSQGGHCHQYIDNVPCSTLYINAKCTLQKECQSDVCLAAQPHKHQVWWCWADTQNLELLASIFDTTLLNTAGAPKPSRHSPVQMYFRGKYKDGQG